MKMLIQQTLMFRRTVVGHPLGVWDKGMLMLYRLGVLIMYKDGVIRVLCRCACGINVVITSDTQGSKCPSVEYSL